ncbi:hypothetical protein ACD591_21220, partial [Rufibacter glacialis]
RKSPFALKRTGFFVLGFLTCPCSLKVQHLTPPFLSMEPLLFLSLRTKTTWTGDFDRLLCPLLLSGFYLEPFLAKTGHKSRPTAIFKEGYIFYKKSNTLY